MAVEELGIYQSAMKLGEDVWQIASCWPVFAQRTIGSQLVRACDSVAANISEACGRYHSGERRQFCYFARGSLEETRTWLKKANQRGLIDPVLADRLLADSLILLKKLNAYIRSIRQTTR